MEGWSSRFPLLSYVDDRIGYRFGPPDILILRDTTAARGFQRPSTPHDLDFSSSLSLVIKSVTSVARVGGVYIYIYISVPLPLTSIPIEASIKRSARADEAARFDKARILSVLFFQRFYLFFSLSPLGRFSFASFTDPRESPDFIRGSRYFPWKKKDGKEASSDRSLQVGWINFRNGLKMV